MIARGKPRPLRSCGPFQIFVRIIFEIGCLITKFTKTLCHENLELYGNTCNYFYSGELLFPVLFVCFAFARPSLRRQIFFSVYSPDLHQLYIMSQAVLKQVNIASWAGSLILRQAASWLIKHNYLIACKFSLIKIFLPITLL